MAAEREPPTATDYVVTALSPVLVMLMVGSLVFFLVEVLYEGKYSGRLLYTLFFFVLGAVLVARIAIETDPTRAGLYGVCLGAAVYVALLTYVEYPRGGWLKSFGWLVNLGLMLLIWWSAHKLTWDCTHIDEKRKGGGRGLLSAAGLNADAPVRRDAERSEDKPRKRTKHDTAFSDWVERYRKYREAHRNAPHTPGVWVIYFALAALPLFALGQSLIRPDDADRRRVSFLLMAVYVGSALGLLVTTSLLGLRRYLRQRRAKIPVTLAGGWLLLGALLIAVFLTVGAFLPRPHSEVSWFGITRAGSKDRDASKRATRDDTPGKGEGNTVSRDPKGSADGKGGDSRSRDPMGSADGKDGDSGSSQNGDEGDTGDGSRDESPPDNKLTAAAEKVAGFLKRVVFAVVAVLVVVLLFLAFLRYLAPFTDWARRWLDGLRNWWAGLWGRREQSVHTDRSPQPAEPVRPPPFTSFSNPFADGTADGRDLAELVAYTFLALDSWAWDRDLGREPTETPLEFAARIAEAFPDLAEALVRFARLYARVTYSDAEPPADALPVLEETWEGLVHGVAADASAKRR